MDAPGNAGARRSPERVGDVGMGDVPAWLSKNGIADIGDFRKLVNGEWRMVLNEGVSCANLARRR